MPHRIRAVMLAIAVLLLPVYVSAQDDTEASRQRIFDAYDATRSQPVFTIDDEVINTRASLIEIDETEPLLQIISTSSVSTTTIFPATANGVLNVQMQATVNYYDTINEDELLSIVDIELRAVDNVLYLQVVVQQDQHNLGDFPTEWLILTDDLASIESIGTLDEQLYGPDSLLSELNFNVFDAVDGRVFGPDFERVVNDARSFRTESVGTDEQATEALIFMLDGEQVLGPYQPEGEADPRLEAYERRVREATMANYQVLIDDDGRLVGYFLNGSFALTESNLVLFGYGDDVRGQITFDFDSLGSRRVTFPTDATPVTAPDNAIPLG